MQTQRLIQNPNHNHRIRKIQNTNTVTIQIMAKNTTGAKMTITRILLAQMKISSASQPLQKIMDRKRKLLATTIAEIETLVLVFSVQT